MRVLVTGARGFTGQYVLSALQKHGHQAIPLHSNLLDRSALMDEVAQATPEAVIHLAAKAFVHDADHQAFYATNVVGTQNLLDALLPHKAALHSVLLASSANVYGHQDGQLAETTAFKPANHYAISKIAMEHCASLVQEELPITLTRPFNYTGADQDPKFLIPKIIHHFATRQSAIELGYIDVSRDFSDVRFVADAYAAIVEKAPKGQTINICSGASHSIRDIIDMCAQITGHALEVRVNPAFVRANEVNVLTGDPQKLHRYCPNLRPIPLFETLQWMLSSSENT